MGSEYAWLDEALFHEEDLIDLLPLEVQRKDCTEDLVLVVQYLVSEELGLSIPVLRVGGADIEYLGLVEGGWGNPEIGIYYPALLEESSTITIWGKETSLSVLLHEMAHHVACERSWDEGGGLGQWKTQYHGPLFLQALKEVYIAFRKVTQME